MGGKGKGAHASMGNGKMRRSFGLKDSDEATHGFQVYNKRRG